MNASENGYCYLSTVAEARAHPLWEPLPKRGVALCRFLGIGFSSTEGSTAASFSPRRPGASLLSKPTECATPARSPRLVFLCRFGRVRRNRAPSARGLILHFIYCAADGIWSGVLCSPPLAHSHDPGSRFRLLAKHRSAFQIPPPLRGFNNTKAAGNSQRLWQCAADGI